MVEPLELRYGPMVSVEALEQFLLLLSQLEVEDFDVLLYARFC